MAREPAETRTAQQVLDYVARADVPNLPPAGSGAPASPDAAPVLTTSRTTPTPPVAEETAEGPQGTRLEGAFEALECRGQIAIVRIKARGRVFLLAVYEPEKVQVRGADSTQLELACGPQNSRPVVVVYDPILDQDLNTLGAVRAIELR
jgi:hypothetical protein